VRDLSRLLHPAVLDDLGLQAAIEWYLTSVARRHEIRTEASFEGLDERFAPEIEAAFYRIVQEALTNVVKHARATTCRVHLHRQAANVMLTLEDDGAGFDPSHPHDEAEPRGLGLIGIRERVRQLGGSVSVESEPGRGTRITAVLPARPRVDGAEHENLMAADMAAAPEWTRG
jgi:signal transduction histidine kinase